MPKSLSFAHRYTVPTYGREATLAQIQLAQDFHGAHSRREVRDVAVPNEQLLSGRTVGRSGREREEPRATMHSQMIPCGDVRARKKPYRFLEMYNNTITPSRERDAVEEGLHSQTSSLGTQSTMPTR